MARISSVDLVDRTDDNEQVGQDVGNLHAEVEVRDVETSTRDRWVPEFVQGYAQRRREHEDAQTPY